MARQAHLFPMINLRAHSRKVRRLFQGVLLCMLCLSMARAEDCCRDLRWEKKPLWNAGVRSALCPGWGQAFNGQRGKGLAYFLTTAGLVAGAAYEHQRSLGSIRDYSGQPLTRRDRYQDYKRERNVSLSLQTAAGIVWALSVTDAVIMARRGQSGDNKVPRVFLGPRDVRLAWVFGGGVSHE